MTKTVPYDGLYCDDRMVGDPKYYLGGKPVNPICESLMNTF